MKKISTKGYIHSRLQLYGISRVELAADLQKEQGRYGLTEDQS